MFVTANQIYVFLACVSFGGCSGIIFSVSELFKRFISNKWLRFLPDFLAFMVVTVLYVFSAYHMRFPNLRLYMILGVMLGVVIYLKSFHILLAKTFKKAYNIIKRIKVKTKDDGIKNKKTDCSVDRGRGIARCYTRVNNALSVNRHKFAKKSTCRTK